MALKLAQPAGDVDKTLWLYELCRFLVQKVNSIIVALFSDNPSCSSITCPEMRASEWQYLCAVHDPPKSCCAIDYCCHTLDWAANTLTSPKHFPSRLALGTDQSTQHSQVRQLTNIFRRVYRIFAHAWFQHREMFWKVEGRTGLYVFFKTVCDYYGLIPEDNYTIPSEAEGIEPSSDQTSSLPPMILKREPSEPGPQDDNSTIIMDGLSDNTLSTAGTTKRHRHSPSVGATAVSTVVEENEEEEERPVLQPRPVTQIFESTPEDEEAAPSEEADKSNEAKKDSTSTDATGATEEADQEKQNTDEVVPDAAPTGSEGEGSGAIAEKDGDKEEKAPTTEASSTTGAKEEATETEKEATPSSAESKAEEKDVIGASKAEDKAADDKISGE